jgi:hypothetical protein
MSVRHPRPITLRKIGPKPKRLEGINLKNATNARKVTLAASRLTVAGAGSGGPVMTARIPRCSSRSLAPSAC